MTREVDVECPDCDGYGYVVNPDKEKFDECEPCQGEGMITKEVFED